MSWWRAPAHPASNFLKGRGSRSRSALDRVTIAVVVCSLYERGNAGMVKNETLN